jgi:hypothetical protein
MSFTFSITPTTKTRPSPTMAKPIPRQSQTSKWMKRTSQPSRKPCVPALPPTATSLKPAALIGPQLSLKHVTASPGIPSQLLPGPSSPSSQSTSSPPQNKEVRSNSGTWVRRSRRGSKCGATARLPNCGRWQHRERKAASPPPSKPGH